MMATDLDECPPPVSNSLPSSLCLIPHPLPWPPSCSLAVSALLPPLTFCSHFPLAWEYYSPDIHLANPPTSGSPCTNPPSQQGRPWTITLFTLQPSMRPLSILSTQSVPLHCYFLLFYNTSHLMCLLMFAPFFLPLLEYKPLRAGIFICCFVIYPRHCEGGQARTGQVPKMPLRFHWNLIKSTHYHDCGNMINLSINSNLVTRLVIQIWSFLHSLALSGLPLKYIF